MRAGANGSGGGDLMQAEWNYYSGDFLNAEIRLHKAIRRACPSGQWGIEIAAWSLQARIDLMRGNLKTCSSFLKICAGKWKIWQNTGICTT